MKLNLLKNFSKTQKFNTLDKQITKLVNKEHNNFILVCLSHILRLPSIFDEPKKFYYNFTKLQILFQ